jgi:thiamine pyrophosphate-dependent acetolactate synthase large subunit-like protein
LGSPDHLINGLYDCHRSRVPVLAIAAHIPSNRQDLSMPPTIELKQALGFSLYMAKAVLNGRGDEIIDLPKTNLIR